MWIELQNLQPTEPTESTESTESREMPEQLQEEVDRYTKWIVGLILRDPIISAPEILRQLKDGGGRCSSEGSVKHLFGGPRMFRKTCSRMEALRWAAVRHQWKQLPFQMDIQYREWGDQRRYFRKYDSNDDWASWRAPDMFSICPLAQMEEAEEGDEDRRLCRFPAQEDESDYFAEDQETNTSQGSDVEMGEVEPE